MSKASTLARIIDDISRKDLGTARERLLGLLLAYPNDPGLRHILGNIYLELQFPQEAGRYLYLINDQSERMQWAIRKYLKFKKTSPFDVLHGLRLRGHIDSIDDEYAKARLLSLFNEAGVESGHFPESNPKRPSFSAPRTNPFVDVLACGCLIILIISVILGAYGIIKWIIHLIGGLF